MKERIVAAVFILCGGLVQSIKVSQQLKFIEGIKFEHEEDAVSSNVQSMAQAEVQDDPIYGSLGLQKPFLGTNNTEFEESRFENYLNKLKPVEWHNDENVNTTWSSLVWAENQVGQQLSLPKKGPYYQEHHSDVLNNNEGVVYDKNYTEDEEITSTLDSITDAEHLMGFRGPPPTNANHAWGAKPSDYNISGEVYNHDWWNYLTKDNGQNGMNPMHLTREQLKDEGYYSDQWYKIHGAHDASGSLMTDSNGQPKANVEHWEGRDNHTKWQSGDDELRVTNKREENKNWYPGHLNEYKFSPATQEDNEKPSGDSADSADSKDWVPPELRINFDKKTVENKAEKPKTEEKPEEKESTKLESKPLFEEPKQNTVQTQTKPLGEQVDSEKHSLVDQEKINEQQNTSEDKKKLSKSDMDILSSDPIKHQNTINIAGEEIEVDPLEGEEDTSASLVQLSSLI